MPAQEFQVLVGLAFFLTACQEVKAQPLNVWQHIKLDDVDIDVITAFANDIHGVGVLVESSHDQIEGSLASKMPLGL